MTQRCENTFRKRVLGSQVQRCARDAKTTVWRMEDHDGNMRVCKKQVCGVCAKRMTTGSDREPSNPWMRKGAR